MTDYIKTIETLQNMVANVEGDEFIALRTAIDSVIQVRAFEETDRWIPCEERLPEIHKPEDALGEWQESDPVLVSYKNGAVEVAQWEVDSEYDKYWVDTLDGGIVHNVIAWQPLPRPYGGTP